eukprot:scaffold277876_cov24-Tisochrysis_lutea.AAC.1
MKSRWEKRDEEEAGGGRLVAKRRKEALNLSDADILSELNSTFASAASYKGCANHVELLAQSLQSHCHFISVGQSPALGPARFQF